MNQPRKLNPSQQLEYVYEIVKTLFNNDIDNFFQQISTQKHCEMSRNIIIKWSLYDTSRVDVGWRSENISTKHKG